MRQLVDPRLKNSIPEMWPSLATIQDLVFTVSDSNQEIPGEAVPVDGMVDIPCRIAQYIQQIPTDREFREGMIQSKKIERQVKLRGYFPNIQTRLQQIVVDGVVYQIVGVEGDSQKFATTLRVEIITP